MRLRRRTAGAFLFVSFLGLVMALGVWAGAQDEINVLSPATDSIVSPLSGPSVNWTASVGLSLFQVQFSADGSFALGNDTVSFPRLGGVAGSPLNVDDRAWKRVVGKAVESSGVMHFRVRAIGSGGLVTSTSRRIFISNASAEGVVDLLMRYVPLGKMIRLALIFLACCSAALIPLAVATELVPSLLMLNFSSSSTYVLVNFVRSAVALG